jgi:hypothetical protein
MGFLENEAALEALVAAMPVLLRRFILRTATLPDNDRARAIGELYEDENLRDAAEVLMDLEARPAVRTRLIGELRKLGD